MEYHRNISRCVGKERWKKSLVSRTITKFGKEEEGATLEM